MTSRFALLTALVGSIALPACAADHQPDVSSEESTEAVVTERDPDVFRAAAGWSGRLVLPNPRRAGAVMFEVQNAPDTHAALRGKTVELRLSTPWESATHVDVAFSDAAKKDVQKGNVLPTRLDGWKNVSPLESLAGARATDDVTVKLKDVAIEGTKDAPVLVTHAEPVQIEGTHVALVKVLGHTRDTLRVRFFSKKSQRFEDVLTDTVGVKEIEKLPSQDFPSATLDGIEKAAANASGFLAYGSFVPDPKGTGKKRFKVLALEPRALLSVSNDTPAVTVKDGGRSFFAKDNWSGASVLPDAMSQVRVASAGHVVVPALGERSLLLHNFGWRARTQAGVAASTGKLLPQVKADKLPPLVTGHFAFGVATVVEDPFVKGALRYDVEYKQVYGQNPEGLLSGSHAWHAYMGSLSRGWMYELPVGDAIVRLPVLEKPIAPAGKSFVPLDVLLEETEKMMARYRVGNGTGVAPITAATSCVQDSSQALFHALERFEKLAADPAVSAWRTSVGASEEGQRFDALVGLNDKLRKLLFGIIPIEPQHWTAAEEGDLAAQGRLSPFGTLIEALKIRNTMLPRSAFDAYAALLLDAGGSATVVHSCQIGGGYRPLLEPLAPTTTLDLFPRRAK